MSGMYNRKIEILLDLSDEREGKIMNHSRGAATRRPHDTKINYIFYFRSGRICSAETVSMGARIMPPMPQIL